MVNSQLTMIKDKLIAEGVRLFARQAAGQALTPVELDSLAAIRHWLSLYHRPGQTPQEKDHYHHTKQLIREYLKEL